MRYMDIITNQKPLDLPISGRTRATEARYYQAKLDGKLQDLLEVPTKARLSQNWNLKENGFPHDDDWKVSEMAVFSEHAEFSDFNKREMLEFAELIIFNLNFYDAIRINGKKLRSVDNIPHIHLLKGQKRRTNK